MARLGDADSQGVDPSRDENDPLGRPGDEIASELECIQGYQLSVHEGGDDHAGRSAVAGAEP